MKPPTDRIVVTGATGFVGRVLCRKLLDRSMAVVAVGRQQPHFPLPLSPSLISVAVGDIGPDTSWCTALEATDTVIHLAGRAHVMRDLAPDPLEAYRRVNVMGTEQLARCAAAQGVRRLVYVSSIKVNGEATGKGRKFTPADVAAPQDPYGVSKWEAEQALHRVAAETGLEVVIVRPPLVYGPGVKGNFARMIKALSRGVPLPFASANNLRDMIYVENLAEALIVCAIHPAATGQTYLVCDGEAISTPDLLREMAAAMGIPARLFPCPVSLLKLAAGAAGKSRQLERLLGSLRVDGDKMRHDLDWTPPNSLHQGLRATAEWYINKRT